MGREERLESTGVVPVYGCWFAYVTAAFVVTICFFSPVCKDPWYSGLLAICLATFIIWMFSYTYSNSSIYDPAWCILPILIALGWLTMATTLPSARSVYCILMLLIWFTRYSLWWPWDGWSVGLETEDWRYKDMLERAGLEAGSSAYWFASLVSLHMVPSMLVFFAVAPLQPVLVAGSAEDFTPFNFQDMAALLVMLDAVVGNGVADTQLRSFREAATSASVALETTHCSKICREGLWAYSRHPNYCCEATFWFGMALAADAGDGARAIKWRWAWTGSIIMFIFFRISGALMDARSLKHRKGYGKVMTEIPGLLPIPVLLDGLIDRLLMPYLAPRDAIRTSSR